MALEFPQPQLQVTCILKLHFKQINVTLNLSLYSPNIILIDLKIFSRRNRSNSEKMRVFAKVPGNMCWWHTFATPVPASAHCHRAIFAHVRWRMAMGSRFRKQGEIGTYPMIVRSSQMLLFWGWLFQWLLSHRPLVLKSDGAVKNSNWERRGNFKKNPFYRQQFE